MEVAGEPIRVQSLAQSGVTLVPPQYIQPPHHRPKHSSPLSPNTIPVIDLFGSDPARRDSVRDAIGRACSDWGAFHVTGHGIPTDLLRRVKRVGLTFFNATPVAEKLDYSSDPTSSVSEGYGSRMLERDDTVLDWRDYFNHHTLPLSRRNPSRWPHFPADYRAVVAEYADRLGSLASELLGLVSESLGLPTRCIEAAVGEFYQNITISYYPPCPQPELTLGLQEHSDMGAITLLIQDDVGGLDVLKDGEWVRVQPLGDDAILVLLADQTEIITNGKYRSAQHRAITNASRARLSVATFHDPAKAVKISPAPQLLSNAAPRFREVVYGDYVSSWYKGPEGKRNIDALLLES
ncbi:Oxoglutarate/iron-dependent dioxygenase [Trema orientale]|uniref:Oxoglutarate/iron-dependent dioxygenase n=1 Tax=Trema orientale TaxID=63057 RepID=A0A2P5EVT1_TREOI|nr:Oxoglutarate/iron-dependent dioxygenase [Trema orientale]